MKILETCSNRLCTSSSVVLYILLFAWAFYSVNMGWTCSSKTYRSAKFIWWSILYPLLFYETHMENAHYGGQIGFCSMLSKWNFLTTLSQYILRHFIFYIGIKMWFHNSDFYDKNVDRNLTPHIGHSRLSLPMHLSSAQLYSGWPSNFHRTIFTETCIITHRFPHNSTMWPSFLRKGCIVT